MTNDSREILISSWATSELWWGESEGWSWWSDRPIGPLSDDDVLAKYGDEAFRRRDILRGGGEIAWEERPVVLIGRRVSAALVQAGWDIAVNSRREFRATKDTVDLAVDGTTSGIVRVQRASVDQVFHRLDDAEQWLLCQALTDEEYAGHSEIMSVQRLALDEG